MDEKKEETFGDERLSVFIATWVKALESKTVSFLVGEDPREPIILSSEDSLESVVEVLKKNNLKSAPVYDTKGNCVGLLNMGSILKYSIRTKQNLSWLLEENFFTSITDEMFPSDMGQDLRKSDVTYLARMKRFNTVDVAQTLLELGQKLKGTPSVGVTDKGKLIAVVSQGHFMKAMNKYEWLKDQKVTMGDLIEASKCPTKLDTANDDSSTFGVFFEMARLNRSALGVVEKDTGVFLGGLNLMDTTTFYEMPDFEADGLVSKYLKKKEKSALLCSKDTLVVDAMTKICSKKSNRIWVIDDKKAVAICSLTDVLGLIS